MKFSFIIERATELVGGRIYALDGTLLEGKILQGADGRIDELGIPIHVKNIALCGGAKAEPNQFTLSIDRPTVPIEQIQAGMLLKGI